MLRIRSALYFTLLVLSTGIFGLLLAGIGWILPFTLNSMLANAWGYLNLKMTDQQKMRAGKISAFVVGAIAIVLGIVFKGMNVSFLVGLAFAVAASANLPAIVMLLFWKRTTAKGITASIFTGIVASLGLICLSPTMYKLYGLDPTIAPVPFSNPGIVSIPLSFITLVVVSLLTSQSGKLHEAEEEAA